MTEMKFTKAERKKSKARIAIAAPSGGGKTTSALLLAKGIAKETGDRIAVIDTERGSASMYDNLVDFDVLDLGAPYTPERYIQAIKAAEAAGYGIIVIDSATHEWSGSGGCLEINEELARARYKGNTWSAWSDTTPRHRDFIDSQMHSTAHIIATFRSKTETVQNSDKKVVKLGMKAESRDNVEYEYSIFFELTHDGHFATASKDRTGLFEGRNFVITEFTGKEIVAWLNSGAEAKMEVGKPDPVVVKAKEPEPIIVPDAPCLIEKTDWVDFGRKMAAAIKASTTFEGLEAWININESLLNDLGKVSPKMRERITKLTTEQVEAIGNIQPTTPSGE
jgi:KaiC/GvpD/RAD55 family RecA-like ATPase